MSTNQRFVPAALSGIVVCLLVAACKPLPDEPAEDRGKHAKQAAEDRAERAMPAAKPTSPVAAPGAAEPPPRASEVLQRVSGGADLPSPKQLPVAEDFQVETAATIVKGNYRAELDSLETDVRADGQ